MDMEAHTYEVHSKDARNHIQRNFLCICHVICMKFKWSSHEVQIIRYEVNMIFIRTACKFMWINLISFHMKFMRSSFVLHTKFIWTFREFHMNKFDFVSYKIRKKFKWTSYEARMKLTIIILSSSNTFYVKLWIYGFIWTSYEWASRSIVIHSYGDLSSVGPLRCGQLCII